ncbi:hypothetical protein BGW38_001221 [Lunasporangiospora selenospora]|uniref:N-acetyltransferase domain-containing protein n=1 Tax=Lunasporangiospora selenospora TaxID=979761 RepID=A0A9P6FTR1_9FUNG|nr:hypothetical protein BGW38_001221 [Lunasporangiospora selenospora]
MTTENNTSITPEEKERLLQIHDSAKPFWLTPTIQLGPLLPTDKDALIRNLNDKRVISYLIGPPYPYTPKDADEWIGARYERMNQKTGTVLHLSFRDMARGGLLIGAIGMTQGSDELLDGDDTGYWLDPAYHGQGLMSKALQWILLEIGIKQGGKRKFNSHAFMGNWASRRTMEKAGFVYQPDLKKEYVKDGETIHAWRFRFYLTEEDVVNLQVIEEAKPDPTLL